MSKNIFLLFNLTLVKSVFLCVNLILLEHFNIVEKVILAQLLTLENILTISATIIHNVKISTGIFTHTDIHSVIYFICVD